MIKIKIVSSLLCVSLILISHANAQVHKYKGSDGSALLSNKSPVVNPKVSKIDGITTKDLKPQNYKQLESQNVEYTYQGTTQSTVTTEKLHVEARDVYKAGLCKMGNVIVPCYGYDKTLPAATYTVPVSKTVNVDSKEVLKEVLNKKDNSEN